MKLNKSLALAFVVLCSTIALLSCSLENNQASSYDVFIPNFSTTNTRGLSSYRIENLEGDISSNSIMQTFPILQSLQKVSIHNLESEIKNSCKNATIWGFNIELDTVKINPDGFYCLYSLKDDTYTVGFLDYYYHNDTNTFSLREMFLYTSSRSGSNNIIFDENYAELTILEYQNMKVTDTTRYGIEFSSEEYDENGMLKNNIVSTTIRINSHTGYSSEKEERSDGEYLNGSWYYPYGYRINSIGVTAKSNDGIFSSYTDPSRKWSDGGFLIGDASAKTWFDSFIAETDLQKIDLAFTKEIVPFFFKDFEDIISYYFNKDATFKSHEEYNSFLLSDFAESISSNTGVRFWTNLATNGHKPLVFDYKNLTGFSLGGRLDHYNCYSYEKDKIIERFKKTVGVDTVTDVVNYLNEVISDYHDDLIPVDNSEYRDTVDRFIPNVNLTVETFEQIVQNYSDFMFDHNLTDISEESHKNGVQAMSDYCGFGVNVHDENYLSQFVTAHLQYCGITNENYIKNFIATVGLCDNVYTSEGITIEEPEIYLKKIVLNYFIRLLKYQ
ncbi:MAG: hypothetical protein ACOWWR_06385 [Eubacteriales bacterium]